MLNEQLIGITKSTYNNPIVNPSLINEYRCIFLTLSLSLSLSLSLLFFQFFKSSYTNTHHMH